MMFAQLHQDAFVRFYGDFGLLVNQRTKVSHLFNGRERVYLGPLDRKPRAITEMLTLLEAALPGTNRLELRRNFTKLLQILGAEGYVVSGESPAATTLKSQARQLPLRGPPRTPNGVALDPALYCARYFYSHPTVFAVQMDLTSACNLRCLHCFYPPERRVATLERDLAFDVLDQLPDLGALSLTLSGGEPLLHPHFDDILQRARKNDLTITIQTNATTLTSEHVSALVAANVNSVGVSLYSLVPEDHDGVTQSAGSFARTMSSIEALREAGIGIYVSTHIMRTNRHSYASVLRWGAENRVKVVADLLMLARTDFATDNLAQRLSIDSTEAVIGELLCYGDEYGKSVDGVQPDPSTFVDEPICGVGTDSISLAADGHYYPCAGFMGMKLGDARQQRLADVWQRSPELQRLRSIRWSDFAGCTRCDAFLFCSMCLARNFNENDGDMYRPAAQNCQVSRANKRRVEDYWRRTADRRRTCRES